MVKVRVRHEHESGMQELELAMVPRAGDRLWVPAPKGEPDTGEAYRVQDVLLAPDSDPIVRIGRDPQAVEAMLADPGVEVRVQWDGEDEDDAEGRTVTLPFVPRRGDRVVLYEGPPEARTAMRQWEVETVMVPETGAPLLSLTQDFALTAEDVATVTHSLRAVRELLHDAGCAGGDDRTVVQMARAAGDMIRLGRDSVRTLTEIVEVIGHTSVVPEGSNAKEAVLYLLQRYCEVSGALDRAGVADVSGMRRDLVAEVERLALRGTVESTGKLAGQVVSAVLDAGVALPDDVSAVVAVKTLIGLHGRAAEVTLPEVQEAFALLDELGLPRGDDTRMIAAVRLLAGEARDAGQARRERDQARGEILHSWALLEEVGVGRRDLLPDAVRAHVEALRTRERADRGWRAKRADLLGEAFDTAAATAVDFFVVEDEHYAWRAALWRERLVDVWAEKFEGPTRIEIAAESERLRLLIERFRDDMRGMEEGMPGGPAVLDQSAVLDRVERLAADAGVDGPFGSPGAPGMSLPNLPYEQVYEAPGLGSPEQAGEAVPAPAGEELPALMLYELGRRQASAKLVNGRLEPLGLLKDEVGRVLFVVGRDQFSIDGRIVLPLSYANAETGPEGAFVAISAAHHAIDGARYRRRSVSAAAFDREDEQPTERLVYRAGNRMPFGYLTDAGKLMTMDGSPLKWHEQLYAEWMKSGLATFDGVQVAGLQHAPEGTGPEGARESAQQLAEDARQRVLLEGMRVASGDAQRRDRATVEPAHERPDISSAKLWLAEQGAPPSVLESPLLEYVLVRYLGRPADAGLAAVIVAEVRELTEMVRAV